MVLGKDVVAYFETLPKNRKQILERLHLLIVDLYPDVVVDMRYKMPTYVVGDGWVAVANQKQYVSLYTCGADHIAEFKKNNPSIKTGKGCVNFKESDNLPCEDIREVIRHAISHPKNV